MLERAELERAIDIQSRSYMLLRWLSGAVSKGFIAANRAHEFADVSDSAFAWIEDHLQNFPTDARPESKSDLRAFANFFSTYVMTSFDIVEEPGVRKTSPCGCYCPWCTTISKAPHLKRKKLARRDRHRAESLMVDRLVELAVESDRDLSPDEANELLANGTLRRSAAYSTYGVWLLRRLHGPTDGKSIMRLWREIAWLPTGSPRTDLALAVDDFLDSEQQLLAAFDAS